MNIVVKLLSIFIVNVYIKVALFRKVKFRFFSSALPWNFNVKAGKAIIGSNLRVRKYVMINVTSGTLYMGDDVFINNFSTINCQCNISIGSGTLLGEGVRIYDHNHKFSSETGVSRDSFSSAPVTIGKNVWIGSNSVILKGVTIGDNAIIAAGSIVTKNIEANHKFIGTQSRRLTS